LEVIGLNKKNNQFWLLLAVLWILGTVISSQILQRALDMSLAISCLSIYIPYQFSITSKQKMYLHQINVFALFAAAVFLVLEIYYMFFA
jgi:hypothetical protein